MITLLIITNITIALLSVYFTIKILKIYPEIKGMVKHIQQVESQTNLLINIAPEAIALQTQQLQQTRHQYRQLTREMQKIAQILALIKFGQNLYTRWRKKSKFI